MLNIAFTITSQLLSKLLLINLRGYIVKGYEAVKKAAAIKGISTNSISRALGKADSYIASGITRGSTPKADTLAAMLKPCGYKLAAIPEDDLPESALVIDPAE